MVDLLIEGLNDDTHNKLGVVEALGNIGNKRAVKPLIIEIENVKKCVSCGKALGKIKDERAVEPLIRILKHYQDNPNIYYNGIRSSIAHALGEIGDKRAIEPLMQEIVTTDRKENQSVAAKSLVKIGKEAVLPLIQSMNHKNETVPDYFLYCLQGLFSLQKIGDKRAIRPLINTLKYNGRAAHILHEFGDENAVELLIQALNDNNNIVRKRAAYALGGIGDKRAIEHLIKALKDENQKVRICADGALNKIDADYYKTIRYNYVDF